MLHHKLHPTDLMVWNSTSWIMSSGLVDQEFNQSDSMEFFILVERLSVTQWNSADEQIGLQDSNIFTYPFGDKNS